MEAAGIFEASPNTMAPCDDAARDILRSLKPGDRVLVRVHKARNVDHHRLAFAVLTKVAEATGQTVDTVLVWLKIGTGHVDIVQLPSGKRVACPKSISFASMSQAEFRSWWEAAWALISERIMPGVSADDFAEIRDIIGGRNEDA